MGVSLVGSGIRAECVASMHAPWRARNLGQGTRPVIPAVEQRRVAPELTRKRKKQWGPHADWLREKVAQKLDATLLELAGLAAER